VLNKKIKIKVNSDTLVLEEARLSNKKLITITFSYFILFLITIFMNIDCFGYAQSINEVRDLILFIFLMIFYNCLFLITPLYLVDYFKSKIINFNEDFIEIKDNKNNLIKNNMVLKNKVKKNVLKRSKVEKSDQTGLYSLILEFKNKEEIILWTDESFNELKNISTEINKFINKKH
jgi:hypothetical protein